MSLNRVTTMVYQKRKKIMSHLKAQRLLLGLWVSLSQQGTTSYEAYIKHLSRVGSFYYPPQDQGNP